MVLLADGLYSKTPMIEPARSLKMNFIFVAKPLPEAAQIRIPRIAGNYCTPLAFAY